MKINRRHLKKTRLFNMQSLIVGFLLVELALICETNGAAVIKRNASPDLNTESAESSGDKLNVNYDEYPLVVPKRAAALLDRLILALSRTLDEVEEEMSQQNNNEVYKDEQRTNKRTHSPKEMTLAHENGYKDVFDDLVSGIERRSNRRTKSNRQLSREETDLKRGGHNEALGAGKGRVYWRCYFNAVTCF